MDISKFAKKPELKKIEIANTDITEAYGPVFFYVYDNVDITTYFDFYKSQSEQDGNQLNVILRKLILNDKGQPSMAADQMLPIDLTLAAISAINDELGKSKTKQSIPTTGEQQG